MPPKQPAFLTKFGAWLSRCGHTEAEIARQLDIHPCQIGRWKRGRTRPTIRLMKRIRRLTKDAVTESDWPEEKLES